MSLRLQIEICHLQQKSVKICQKLGPETAGENKLKKKMLNERFTDSREPED